MLANAPILYFGHRSTRVVGELKNGRRQRRTAQVSLKVDPIGWQPIALRDPEQLCLVGTQEMGIDRN